MTSQQDNHAIPSSSHSTLQQSPPKRFGLGNALPKIHLPNFFLPPQGLEQTMRQRKMTALTRPPPRGLDHTSVSDKHKESQQSNMVSERTRPDLSLQDMQRVARIFASKPS
ncbi:uncharacterized protein [Dysidea avara]|uniref:uncharacterized protein n=1 Tax=Dysidea avara TaxID=196820 RepID=UPI0033261B15